MRLSEFKDENAIQVVADLMGPIGRIAANAQNADSKGKSMAEFAGALLRNNPKDAMEMLAILDGEDPAEYHCTAASILVGLLDMFNDPELMGLFGLRSGNAASSGSASESTGAPGQ